MTQGPETISVLVAEDHRLFSEGVKIILQGAERFHVRQARNGQEAVDMAAEHTPDIVLMDILMPEMDGLEAARLIKQTHATPRIIMLTSLTDGPSVHKALRAGAEGYCSKDIDFKRLITVIDMVHSGAMYLDAAIAQFVLTHYFPDTSAAKVSASDAPPSASQGGASLAGLPSANTLRAGASPAGLAAMASQAASPGQSTQPGAPQLIVPAGQSTMANFVSMAAQRDDRTPAAHPGAEAAAEKLARANAAILKSIEDQKKAEEAAAKPAPTGHAGNIPDMGFVHPSADILARREIEVLSLVADNRTNEEIAEALQISTDWVNSYLQNIMGKLAVHSKYEAVVRAVQDGVIANSSMMEQAV